MLDIKEAVMDKSKTEFDSGNKTVIIFSMPRSVLLRNYENPKSGNLDGGTAMWHSTGVVDDVWMSSTLGGRMTGQD